MTTPTDPLSLAESFNNLSHLVITKMHLEWSDVMLIIIIIISLLQALLLYQTQTCVEYASLVNYWEIFR